ncbi:MAG: metallophosphoesterase [Propionibacteriaceae bacterium]|jgi:predicted MPP superfamily phosphohydrolase|nr:metallophosphoesterase [Propionibacteriaceae bacterium]
MRFLMPLVGLALLALLVDVGRLTHCLVKAVWPRFHHPVVFGLAFAVVVVGLVAASLAGQNGASWGRPLAWAGDLVMAALLYAMLAALLIELARLVGRLTGWLPQPTPRRLILITGVVVVALIASLLAYGLANRTYHLAQTDYSLELTADDPDQAPVTAVLVSDLHLGQINRAGHLAKVVDAVLATDPDIVLVAGDIFDGDFRAIGDPAPIKAQLERLRAPLGVFAILGNHDAGSTNDQMVAFIEDCGLTLLADQAVEIDGRFSLVGRRDSSPIGQAAERQAVPQLADGSLTRPVIVLDHQPSHLREYLGQADLMLSGHTHQGQIFPVNLMVKALFEVAYGYYQVPDADLQAIVTSGAGTWGPPLRIASNSEIVTITWRPRA